MYEFLIIIMYMFDKLEINMLIVIQCLDSTLRIDSMTYARIQIPKVTKLSIFLAFELFT